ncbi:hypothetical protein KRX52_05730 [Pseudomonas sp. MAP12]|uniref:Uncharacterized protein n=1 Tax=Geopseudomonas aromaticivorans TaxID=2849492 RepID=A0ABS6MUR7_9GAMM|nr:hypothetical protein [Pseudomonas aromaticivorans]MBV2132300.1 hypothetical protein [Pseudomonas aromaticivorans]
MGMSEGEGSMGRQAKQHWYALYRTLKPQIDAYQGQDSVNLLISQLADEAGYDAKVLLRMLKAGSFLDALTGPLNVEQVQCGYAHIELLERLHHLDAATLPEEYVTQVLANKVTLAILRAQLVQTTQERGTAQSTARSRARQRVAGHERRCIAALKAVGPGYFGYPEGELIKVTESEVLSQCVLLREGDRARVAIFTRAGDTSRKPEKAAAELFRVAQMASRYVEKVWFVFPEPSSLLKTLAYLALDTGSLRRWLHLATLDGEDAPIQEFTDLRHALNMHLNYGNSLEWAGITLTDQRHVRDSLKPLPNTPSTL